MGVSTTDEKREWLRRVLDQHEEALRRYLLRLTGDPEAAAAVVEGTFRKLWNADPIPAEDKLAEWLFRVGRNVAIEGNRLRRGVDAQAAEAPKRAGTLGATPVQAALGKLNQVQQEVLRLKFQYNLSYREIGGILNLTVSNVSLLIHGALQQLRKNPQMRGEMAFPK